MTHDSVGEMRKMKEIKILLDDKEYKELIKHKNGRTWKAYFRECALNFWAVETPKQKRKNMGLKI